MDNDNTSHTTISTDDAVGFPTPAPKPKQKPFKWIVLLLIVLLIAVGAAAFFIYNSNQTIEPESTPESATFQQIEQSTPEPESTPEPIDRSEISIQILNGTGITGEANYLETQLKELGYEKFDKGNNSSQSETTTTVTFASTVSDGVKEEIMQKLEEVYNEVEEDSGSTGAGIDIKVITGVRKGASPRASATTAAKATATPRASASPRPTATP